MEIVIPATPSISNTLSAIDPPFLGGGQVTSLVVDPLQHFVDGGDELLDSLTLERRDDVVVADAGGVELVEEVLGLVEIGLEP